MNESDGTLQVEGAGLTLMSLVGGPVAMNLQMGDDVGETTATFSAPGGIPPQPGGEFYSVTNRGELLIIDLGAETGTLVGKAPSVGWTGLAFSPDGRLFTSSQVRDGNTSDGCLDGWFLLDGKCAHIYQVDPSTGGILTHVGNTGIEFLSDLQFGTDGLLLGSEFINERQIRDGGLVKIDLATGLAAEKGTFGTFEGFVVGNGGLALHPSTGQLWGIEANDLRPRIFKIDAVTGAASPPVTLLQNGHELGFGLDGLGILENGNFYATRGSGFQEVYRVDPVTGEVRLQNLTLGSSIKGGLNGLDIFVEPSGAPPPPAEIGVSDTFLRKDKSGKSAQSKKSGKSGKSKKSGKSAQSKKSGKSKRTDNRHTNEGGNPRLELEKDQDVLVAFDVGDLDFSTVTGARLILTIDPSYGSTGWGSKGGKAEIKYLETAFGEGNGINTGPVEDRVRGTGVGATNACSS